MNSINSIEHYLTKINHRYLSEHAGEHAYRADLQNLLESFINENIKIINEPNKVKCGKPDYMLFKEDIEIGSIETKDIGKNLASNEYTEQFNRYKKGLGNLILTDYLYFELYQNGEKKLAISIAEIKDNAIIPLEKNYLLFENLINSFINYKWQSINTPLQLANILAGKAKLFADVVNQVLAIDLKTEDKTDLKDQIEGFKEVLLHDIQAEEFADIYAQTIAYGLFIARLHDDNLNRFSRKKAARLIPLTNPFLNKLFSLIEKDDLDERITWIIDSLINIFLVTNIEKIKQQLKKQSDENDPIIHFYETFLAEYNPDLRKSRGVWYTPQPIVNFIIRAVDDILKTEFNLSEGLADKTTITLDIPIENKKKTEQKTFHKVQILDPATGTGTFLAETVKHIHQTKSELNPQEWSGYVEKDLIPRLNGFELLMASYAMAHLKLDLLLGNTGFKPTDKNQRFNIYLTNSLDDFKQKETKDLEVARWLLKEADGANRIKKHTPVMVVMGNPPYSVSSRNKSGWIEDLLKIYKKDLNEKNIQPLSDDYIKFIRLGEHFIEKNNSGILAYISNNSFIDGITHRQMRKTLLETFDKIYILDLHGSNKKGETAGGKDENVFDIMQGVSINIFVKTGKKLPEQLAEVYHVDFFGKRKEKYARLKQETLETLFTQEINYQAPNYFFVPKNFDIQEKYNQFISLSDLFILQSSGIKTHRDDFVIDFDDNKLSNRIQEFYNLAYPDEKISSKFNLKNSSTWDIKKVRKESKFEKTHVKLISYRPFDSRYIYYDSSLIDRGRETFMQNLIKNNIALLLPRQAITGLFGFFITDKMCDINFTGIAGQYGAGLVFPLYTYPEKPKVKKLSPEKKSQLENSYQIESAILTKLEKCFSRFTKAREILTNQEIEKLYKAQEKDYLNQKETVEKIKALLDSDNAPIENFELFDKEEQRKPNFNREIIAKIANSLSLKFTDEKEDTADTFAPIDVLDYIYAVLHSLNYRETYKEFLKIDFPRIPYPEKNNFWELVKLGSELRQLHLLEAESLLTPMIEFHGKGDNKIERKMTKADFQITDSVKNSGQIWINDSQYFDQVPVIAWEFYIGGYQPAQKWLKDRYSRQLSFDDILHYQKIIKALSETARIMQAIDLIGVHHAELD